MSRQFYRNRFVTGDLPQYTYTYIALSVLDKAIFGYGYTGSNVSITNLVSNLGIVTSDETGVGTARYTLAAAGYGI